LRRLNSIKTEPNWVSENMCSHSIGPSSVVQRVNVSMSHVFADQQQTFHDEANVLQVTYNMLLEAQS
jgi:hypothetical protein